MYKSHQIICYANDIVIVTRKEDEQKENYRNADNSSVQDGLGH